MAISMASTKDTVTMESAMEALSLELSKDANRATSPIVERRSSHKHTDFSPERSIESYGLLDLYSRAAFLTVLHTPRIYDSFSAFLCTEHSSENLHFWTRCELYKQRQRNLSDSLQIIDRQHLQVNSEEELNICHRSKMEGIQQITNALHVLEGTDRMFEELQDEVEMLMWRDTYPRFLKHHMAYSASKSLENPGRMSALNGLGECFCITDPRKPDNPVVMVSDAFVQVTGFLQGSLSDRATIGRIRDAVKQGRESTEIFLNYRIDGTPFWNFLLVAPLKDDSGMIQHFFGAQVDISPLFQKYNDLSAIFSKDFALSEPPAPPNGPRKSFFRRLSDKAKGRNHMMSKWPGLEEEVFRNNITIGEQIDVFRTAYGKYLLVDATSGKIQFSSERAKTLFPQLNVPLSRQHIFPLLTATFDNIDSRSMKLLKHAFSHGQPSSVRLATSQPCSPETELTEYIDEARSRQSSNSTTRTSSTGSSSLPIKIGEPIVAIHMTPMKDGNEKVSMFVFVLATGM